MRLTLKDFLTEKNIQDCIKIYGTDYAGNSVKRIKNEVILPNLETINKKIGQENDATYLAYAVYYVLSKASS